MKNVRRYLPARLLLLCSLWLTLLVLPRLAHAGYYSASYSGGAIFSLRNGQSTTTPYDTSNGLYGGMSTSGWGSGNWTPTTAGLSCQGAITVTFTWHSAGQGDTPPDNAVVKQQSTATWGYMTSNGATLTGGCDDGLGDLPSPSLGPATSTGTHYQIQQNPGQSFTITCTPTAQVSGSSQSYQSANFNVQVQYGASAWPVTLTLSGTTYSNGTDNILVGQGCSAGFSTDAPVTFSNYQWSTNNGATFASFYISSDQKTGHVVYCDPAIWTSANPQWYWFNKGDGTVNGSATVSCNGQAIGTVQSTHPVTVWLPYSKMWASPYFTLFESEQAGVTTGDTTGNPGIKFYGRVGTQDMFLGQGTGQWCFAQLCWLDRVQYLFQSPIGNAVTTTGTLDGAYSIYGCYWPADSQADLPDERMESDTPAMGFLGAVGAFRVSDSFKMYIMYMPPDGGTGTQWVPLNSVLWHWSTQGTRYSLDPFSPDPPNGSVTADGATAEHQHPRWTDKYNGHE